MMKLIRTADSVFSPAGSRPIVHTAARGEAVDMDKYDSEGRENPFHGWTLDFPEHVPHSERTYSNKDKAQGWYDDPENQPHFDSKWGGTGDYADRNFYTHTQQYSQHDPNRGDTIDSSGALGRYGIGEEDLNEYLPNGRGIDVGDMSYPPAGWYNDAPTDLNPWEDVEQARQERERERAAEADRQSRAPSSPHLYGTPPQNFVPGEGRVVSELPAGHNHAEHDDLENEGRVFGIWHGGSNYAEPDVRHHMESFPSIEAAQLAVARRYSNHNRGHGGEVATYHPETDSYHLTGDSRGSDSSDTPLVGHDSYMDIYPSAPRFLGDGWHVNLYEVAHRIWPDEEGDAIIGTPAEHEYSMESMRDGEDDDDFGDLEDEDSDEERGSHPKREDFIRAGFYHRPHEYNGDTYSLEDHNGNTHVLRAPNPAYGAMDSWHYEFHPKNEQDRDPYGPRDPSRDGPRTLSFAANTPEEAWNLHQNLGNDLSELAARGWGIKNLNLGAAGIRGNAREDNRAIGGSHHEIEAQRRSADDSGYDRIVKTMQGWHVHHVPDPTPGDAHPRVSVVHSSQSRRDALDEADRFDSRRYLGSRVGNGQYDPETGHETYEIPHASIGTDHFNVQVPGSGSGNPRWTVTHRRGFRTQTHTSYPHWVGARNELMGRI